MISIMPAERGEALEQFLALAHEYVTWMVEEIEKQYPELDIAEFTSEHDYDDMRKKFPGGHVPPEGGLLIAVVDEMPAGCIALGRFSPTICEIRTLFVRPAFRGTGVGRKLVETSIQEARKLRYQRARLDTLGFMEGALGLYQSFGFYAIEPYMDVSDSLRQYIRFLELNLA